MSKEVRCISLELSSPSVTFHFPSNNPNRNVTNSQCAKQDRHKTIGTSSRFPSLSLTSSLLPEPTVVRLPSYYCVAPSMPHMITSPITSLTKLSQTGK